MESTDDSPLKSVSTLRSRFEGLRAAASSKGTPPPQPQQQSEKPEKPEKPLVPSDKRKPPPHPIRHDRAESSAGRLEPMSRTYGRASLDLPPRDSSINPFGDEREVSQKDVISTLQRQSQKPRPLSVGSLSPPPSATTPTVTVMSPRSPPKMGVLSPISPMSGRPPPPPSPRLSRGPSPSRTPPPPVPAPASTSAPPPPSRHKATGSKYENNLTPVIMDQNEPRKAPLPPASAPPKRMSIDIASKPPPPRPPPLSRETSEAGSSARASVANSRTGSPDRPPIPDKPKVFGATAGTPTRVVPPILGVGGSTPPAFDRVSPFNTPPASDEGSSGGEDPQLPSRRIPRSSYSETSAFPSRPTSYQQPPTDRGRAKPIPPPPPPNPPKAARPTAPKPDFKIMAPPHLSESRRSSIDSRSPRNSTDEARPQLPARPQSGIPAEFQKPNLGSRGRSYSPPKASSVMSPTVDAQELSSLFPPPPKRIHSNIKASSPGRGSISSPSTSSMSTYATESTVRTSLEMEVGDSNEYPDSSGANRKKPLFRTGPREIQCKHDVKLFAVCGQYACTTSHVTQVWDLGTGEHIMSLHHGETMKITALAFKPSANVADEGSQLWLGTSFGDLMEVDIPSQKIVDTRSSAHTKKEVIKIHRHGYELWSMDDGGKLQVWSPDVSTRVPSLRNSPRTFRVPGKHSCSLVAGNLLWIASGKDISVYHPSADPNIPFNLLDRPISQIRPCGEITCGAIVNSVPDTVFFGHLDGKVSIYSTQTLTCIDVVNVSVYKINSMSGVGDYLWAGFQTGMVYVYDVRKRPWRVLKDWKAHEKPVQDVVADRTSIWKIDRLQVVSLSSDNVIRVWDGMLQEDWLADEMQRRDVEFCDFRELTALVCTWNAGASKPNDLNSHRDDNKFMQNVLGTASSPDIIVFGFQELVDLENKKVTAKSFFKSSKKSEKHMKEGVQEHMSRQYRLWQEYLTSSIEKNMPRDTKYQLLHAANLVGLFTCIYVKASERYNIRNVSACTIKTGLGGIHGNKGALVIRFLLDDSSVCFINCHLAAGQSGTRSRNKDIADILESNSLSPETDLNIRNYSYIGGGDGSMILDHEICILNGDLNYRIDHPSREQVITQVRQGEIDRLLERDQLLIERRRNPGFRLRSFNEGPIAFAPTYKYDVGTDNYDSSEKKRVPSWCDRILYRGLGRIKQLDYQRHEVHTSDHRPVSGTFLIRLKTVSKERRDKVIRLCQKKYEEVKQAHVQEAKLDFLVNVCGYPHKQALKTLQSEANEVEDAVYALQMTHG